MFLVLLLVVRGTPVYVLYRKVLSRAERLPMALFSATGLPLIVVITSIGTAEGRMRPVNAAALVGAGILSVLFFPALGLRRLQAVVALARSGSPDAPRVEAAAEGAATEPSAGPEEVTEGPEPG